MATMIWRCRIPDWAWKELIVSGELIGHVHTRIEEIAKEVGRAKVRIGKRGRWVWVTRDDIEQAAVKLGRQKP